MPLSVVTVVCCFCCQTNAIGHINLKSLSHHLFCFQNHFAFASTCGNFHFSVPQTLCVFHGKTILARTTNANIVLSPIDALANRVHESHDHQCLCLSKRLGNLHLPHAEHLEILRELQNSLSLWQMQVTAGVRHNPKETTSKVMKMSC